MTSEKDPLGKDQHEPGAKLDLGKIRPDLILKEFVRALEGVVKVGEYGAKKYTVAGWCKVPDAIQRYKDAAERHRLRMQMGEVLDEESGLPHVDHYVWNCLAVSELEKR